MGYWLCGFVEQIHELHGAALEQTNDAVNTCYQEIVCEHSQNTNNQTTNSSHHRLIHTCGEDISITPPATCAMS